MKILNNEFSNYSTEEARQKLDEIYPYIKVENSLLDKSLRWLKIEPRKHCKLILYIVNNPLNSDIESLFNRFKIEDINIINCLVAVVEHLASIEKYSFPLYYNKIKSEWETDIIFEEY